MLGYGEPESSLCPIVFRLATLSVKGNFHLISVDDDDAQRNRDFGQRTPKPRHEGRDM